MRIKAIRNPLTHNHSWTELSQFRFEASRAFQVFLSSIWADVDRRLRQLKKAQELVNEDPEILRGTPVIRGTRIPVYDVASLVDAETSAEELRKLYPKLTQSQIELASIYAKANPQRGRPRHRQLPKSLSPNRSRH